MKSNELRIGNWVSGNDFKEYKITISDLVYLDKGEDITRIHPIKLTIEWLSKAGFRQKNDGRWVIGELKKPDYCYDISIWYDDEENVIFWRHDRNIILKSVHQLQNLYFALTGNELTFKM